MKSLAIDNDDAYIGRGELYFSQNAVIKAGFRQAKKEISYSRLAISSNWERKISAFITGYTTSKQSLALPLSLTIEIEVNYLADSFELIFNSYDVTS